MGVGGVREGEAGVGFDGELPARGPAERLRKGVPHAVHIYLVRHDGRKFHLEHKLEKLEMLLDPAVFFRLNRRYLAPLRAIDKIYPYFAGKLKIELLPPRAEEILVSRDRTPLLKRWLE